MDKCVLRALRYIEEHYALASLEEFALSESRPMAEISRAIHRETGSTFKELLQIAGITGKEEISIEKRGCGHAAKHVHSRGGRRLCLGLQQHELFSPPFPRNLRNEPAGLPPARAGGPPQIRTLFFTSSVLFFFSVSAYNEKEGERQNVPERKRTSGYDPPSRAEKGEEYGNILSGR